MTTDQTDKTSFLALLPLVMRGTQPARPHLVLDRITTDDPLPSALKIDGSGYVLARDTRATKMQQETTDDN